MGVSVRPFGTFEGKPIRQFTLTSDSGVEVDIIEFGVAVRDWRVPVAGGKRSVVLGFEAFDDYPRHSPHLGAVAGPVANRIGGAWFSVGGKRYELEANEGANHLHGGSKGLGMQPWTGEADVAHNAVRFSFHMPAGSAGYPGNKDFTATYSLKGKRLRLEFAATSDAATPISLVQHQYFNLGMTDNVLEHRYRIESSAFTEVGADLVPTGNILQIAPGSERDLRTGRTLRHPDGGAMDFDGNYVLDAGRDPGQPVATVTGPDGALTLRLWTDRPGLQVYDGVMTNVPVPGLGGRRYGKYSGFCLEDQAFPDAVHHPHFPSVWYGPDRAYSHWCEIEIA